jgi:2-hydroxycyclohexanecarboxyl-CoA dehydrogenase
MVSYDSAKGGVEAFTRAAALDLAPYGVRVVCIVPGLMETSDTGAAAEERARATALTVPLGRQGTGADIAGAAVFLAGEDASYLTGSCIYVDGGVLHQQRSPEVETFPLERFPRVGRLA